MILEATEIMDLKFLSVVLKVVVVIGIVTLLTGLLIVDTGNGTAHHGGVFLGWLHTKRY